MEDLRDVLKKGKKDCIFFIGAGVSRAISDNELSVWTGLLNNGIETCCQLPGGGFSKKDKILYQELIGSSESDNLLTAASTISRKLGGNEGPNFKKWIDATIGSLKIKYDSLLKEIVGFEFPLVTTNYDTLIEKSEGFRTYSWMDNEAANEILAGARKNAVLHLHGHWKNPGTIIFDWDSYNIIISSPFIQSLLNGINSYKTIIFIGFGEGMKDPNFSGFINWSRKHGVINSVNKHFILVNNDIYKEISNDSGFPENIIPVSFGAKHDDLPIFLKGLKVHSSRKDEPEPEPDYILPPLPKLISEYLIAKQFVGRGGPLNEVQAALDGLMNNNRQSTYQRYFIGTRIIWVSGFGGMGKSWFLRKAYLEAQRKYDNLQIGLIDWHMDELSQPYPKPTSVEQMLEVISQRIGQLYGADTIANFRNELKNVRKCHSENNKLEAAFKKALDDFERKIKSKNPSDDIAKGDYIKPKSEIEFDENISILDTIFKEKGLLSHESRLKNYIDSIREDDFIYENIFMSWAQQKLNSNQNDGVTKPDQSLTLALKECILGATQSRPLFLILDTCELLSERLDRYLRLLCKALLAQDANIMILIGNRFVPDINQVGRYSKYGWLQEIENTQLKNIYFDKEPFSISDIDSMLVKLTNSYPVNAELAVKLFNLSKGVPFTIKNILALHEKGDTILTNLDEVYRNDLSSLDFNKNIETIIKATCDRILIHLEDHQEDLEDIVLLAVLQKPDEDILKCYWNAFPRSRIESLMKRHSFITNGDLHEEVRTYFRRHWRVRPNEKVGEVVRKLEFILSELKPDHNSCEVSIYSNWFASWLNVNSWLFGEKIIPDVLRVYFLCLMYKEDVKTLLALNSEINSNNGYILKCKQVIRDLPNSLSYFNKIDTLVLKFLEEFNFRSWDDGEKGCLFLFLGDNYYKDHNYEKSIEWFDRAFSLFVDKLPEQTLIVKSYLDAVSNQTSHGKQTNIIDNCLKWSLKFDFASFGFYLELGKVLHNAGDYEESNRMLEKALTQDSLNTETFIYLIHNYVSHLHKYEKAILIIDQNEELLRYDARAHLHKGMAYEAIKQFEKAKDMYLGVLKFGWGYEGTTHTKLGRLYLDQLGDEKKGIVYIKKAIGLSSDEASRTKAKIPLGVYYEKKGIKKESMEVWSEISKSVDETISNPADLNTVGWDIYTSGLKIDIAEKAAKKGLDLAPNNVNILQTLLAILIRQDKWSDCIPYFRNWMSKVTDERVIGGMEDFILMFRDIVKYGREKELISFLGDSPSPVWNSVRMAVLKAAGVKNDISPSNQLTEDIYKQLMEPTI